MALLIGVPDVPDSARPAGTRCIVVMHRRNKSIVYIERLNFVGKMAIKDAAQQDQLPRDTFEMQTLICLEGCGPSKYGN